MAEKGELERDDRETEPESQGPVSLRSPKTMPPESGSPATPRNLGSSIERTALDTTPVDLVSPISRATRRPGDPDTLISAPRPAERDELEVKERFRLLEDRIDELDSRVRVLERRRPEQSATRSQPWWIWLIFLLGLAVTWRLLEALR